MKDTIWTPLHLRIMLHYYVSPESFKNTSDTANDYTRRLIEEGLLQHSLDALYGEAYYEASDKGKAFVEMLCLTPVPEHSWSDPRFKT